MSGYIAILGGQWATYAVAMLTTAYITRVLGPNDYAKFIQMQFVYGIFNTVFNLAISSAVSKYAAEHAAKGELSRASGVLRAGLKITLIMGFLASITMLLFSNQLAGIIIGDISTTECIILLSIATGLTVAISPLTSYVYALQKFREYSLISILSFAFWRTSLVVALLLGTGLYGLSFAWMVDSIILSLVIAIPILRMAGRAETYPVTQLFSYSMPLAVSTYLGFLSQWIDSLLLPYVGSMRMLSMVNIAGTMTNLTLVLINSASTVLFTHFVMVDAIDGREALLEAGQRISRLLFYCFVPLGFFVGAVSDLLVFLYAGSAFSQAASLLRILSPFMTTSAVFFIIWTNEVTAVGKTRLLLLNTIVTLASYSILGILLVPWLGEVGYLLSKILCNIVAFPYAWIKTKAIVPVRVDFRALLLSILFSTVIIIPSTIIEASASSYLLTSASSILGFACYALIINKTGLIRKEEAKLILKIIARSLRFQVRNKKLNNKNFSKSSNYNESLKNGSKLINQIS
jgi:O-antigen/teichoic acid export membrane protein